MDIDIVTVFPEYFGELRVGLLGKAQESGLLGITVHNLRDWTHDVHHSVDDTPVGGGAGMVMKPEVWAECLDDLLGMEPATVLEDAPSDTANKTLQGDVVTNQGQTTPDSADFLPSPLTEHTVRPIQNSPVLIFPNPSAPRFSQAAATELSHADRLIFACGRYEGYDARIPQYYRAQSVDVREYSIGDYVLNGGEAAASVMLEAITRLIPGFMGNPESIVEESYTGENALLEHLQYTRPTTWRGMTVPEILTSGNHGKVDRFRRDEALERTSRIRPDLIEALNCAMLSKPGRKTLMALGWEISGMHPRR